MSWLTGPTRSLVKAIMWFPSAFRPGLFALVVFALGWLATQRGDEIWHWLCRSLAAVVDAMVGVVLLLPEYAITTGRRRFGGAPGRGTIVLGNALERVLDGATTLYSRHAVRPKPAPRFPWRLGPALVAVPLAAWLVRDLAPGSEVAAWILRVWHYWHTLQNWAEA